jgi:hypothetical protein
MPLAWSGCKMRTASRRLWPWYDAVETGSDCLARVRSLTASGPVLLVCRLEVRRRSTNLQTKPTNGLDARQHQGHTGARRPPGDWGYQKSRSRPAILT